MAHVWEESREAWSWARKGNRRRESGTVERFPKRGSIVGDDGKNYTWSRYGPPSVCLFLKCYWCSKFNSDPP